ncbi:hypothetical protein A3224_12465 [Microbulbifer thermotolerans]|uniref:Protein kinase domain-containing protein n=1 Tax=Microbulbifer thermotolerans TaxID=252514 RepID=A0A143HNI9_MICTH|nr:hypothetical protein A3224_12465 [Microbulbifer thermotolerans]
MEIAESEQEQPGRHQIERTLGAGCMGIVYLTRDAHLQCQAAINKLGKDVTSASAGARIQSEAQLLAKLNHPNIVQPYDVLEGPRYRPGDGIWRRYLSQRKECALKRPFLLPLPKSPRYANKPGGAVT